MRSTVSHVEDESLLVIVRRVKMALEKACALLTGRLPRRDVSIEIPTAEKAVTYRLTSMFVPWMPTPNLGSRNSDVPPQAPGVVLRHLMVSVS